MTETYLATANYVWPAAVDTLPLVKTKSHFRLHVFAHSRDPHPAIKLWCQVPFTKSKTIFQIEIYCMQCFSKSTYIKVELSMIKVSELLWKLWSLISCFLILPPGALAPLEAWREQTLVYPPVMCQQRLSYCTWELNIMNHKGHYRI